MAEIECVPEDRRDRIEELVARGQASRAIQLLEVWVTQFAVTSWAMQLLGELQSEAGNRNKAGFAFFWSGVRKRRTASALHRRMAVHHSSATGSHREVVVATCAPPR